jgi:hypothetical protein
MQSPGSAHRSLARRPNSIEKAQTPHRAGFRILHTGRERAKEDTDRSMPVVLLTAESDKYSTSALVPVQEPDTALATAKQLFRGVIRESSDVS